MTRRATIKNSARPAGFPGEHLSGGVLPEEPEASEIAEHASTDRLPEGLHVGAGDGGGLVEADGGAGRVVGAVPCRGLEDAAKDADVVVEVGVERGTKDSWMWCPDETMDSTFRDGALPASPARQDSM